MNQRSNCFDFINPKWVGGLQEVFMLKQLENMNFHFKHPGGSSCITDASGSVNQHLQYLPYGEDYIYQRNNEWDVPYTFSGKEKDVETGYSYFGARYYDSDISVWLSVDPMSDDYPHISSYNYVEHNPQKYIDEEGENPIGALIGGLVGAATEVFSQTMSNGLNNMANGQSFFKDWNKNMDWADVGITAIEGALIGSGVGAALVPYIEGGAAIARSGVDWKGDDKTPNVILGQGDYKKDWAEFGYDIAGEVLSIGLKYGSGLNKVDFYDKNSPDFPGAFWKTTTVGALDGIWKSPSTILKNDYKQNRTISLPPVEIVGLRTPKDPKYDPKENESKAKEQLRQKGIIK